MTSPWNDGYLLVPDLFDDEGDADTERPCLLRQPDGAGFLTRSTVANISGSSDIGKTTLLVYLAVCVIVGRPFLGLLPIAPEVVGRHVFLALAEDDKGDLERIVYRICNALGLTADERKLVLARLCYQTTWSGDCSLVDGDHFDGPDGRPEKDTMAMTDLLRILNACPPPGWALVGIDPLSSFAAAAAEVDNHAARRTVNALQRLRDVIGSPTVMTTHHTSQSSRENGKPKARGVTGLIDAMKWAATLRTEGEDVAFLKVTKANGLASKPGELRLERGAGGLWLAKAASTATAKPTVTTPAELVEERVARAEAAILAAVAARGTVRTMKALRKLGVGRQQTRSEAIGRLLASEQLRKGVDGYQLGDVHRAPNRSQIGPNDEMGPGSVHPASCTAPVPPLRKGAHGARVHADPGAVTLPAAVPLSGCTLADFDRDAKPVNRTSGAAVATPLQLAGRSR